MSLRATVNTNLRLLMLFQLVYSVSRLEVEKQRLWNKLFLFCFFSSFKTLRTRLRYTAPAAPGLLPASCGLFSWEKKAKRASQTLPQVFLSFLYPCNSHVITVTRLLSFPRPSQALHKQRCFFYTDLVVIRSSSSFFVTRKGGGVSLFTWSAPP